jgi:hypothetical protein
MIKTIIYIITIMYIAIYNGTFLLNLVFQFLLFDIFLL